MTKKPGSGGSEESGKRDQASGIEISCTEVQAMLEAGASLKLLDVRTEEERAIASIQPSQLVTQELFEEILNSWPKEAPIVLYCHRGQRSLEAARILRERGGFTKVKSMAGGIAIWSATIDPDVPTY